MRKTWFISLTMTFVTLVAAPSRAAAQVPPVTSPGAPRPTDVSARPEVKERHHTDAGFAREAAAGGRKEVDAATFAALTTSSPDVKALANRLVKDHTAANKELHDLMDARKLAPVDEPVSTKAEPWRTETGTSFDRAYIEHVIDEHEDAIELFEEQVAMGTDARLKAWAQEKLTALREHLTMARDLKSKLGS